MVHRRTMTTLAAACAPLFVTASCLKSLDEGLIDALDGTDAGRIDSAAGAGAGAAGGAGGSAGGTGGDAGTTGGTGSAGMPPDAGKDTGSPDAGFIPYDGSKHPVTVVGNENVQPLAIGVDASHVFRAQREATTTTLVSRPLGMGPGVPVSGNINRPAVVVAPPLSTFVFVGGGFMVGDQGRIFRALKAGGGLTFITDADPDGGTPAIGRVTGMTLGSDNKLYLVARAPTAGAPHVLRLGITASDVTAETVYTSEANSELGGDITASSSCAIWISSGRVWSVPTGGGARAAALDQPVNDAVGITSDAQNFYYTRSNGEVWQRGLDPACGGAGAAELRLAGGYTNVGDLVAFDGKVAWLVRGGSAPAFAGAGIFTTPAGGGVIEQVAPATDGPDQIAQNTAYVVFATANGLIKRIDKK